MSTTSQCTIGQTAWLFIYGNVPDHETYEMDQLDVLLDKLFCYNRIPDEERQAVSKWLLGMPLGIIHLMPGGDKMIRILKDASVTAYPGPSWDDMQSDDDKYDFLLS